MIIDQESAKLGYGPAKHNAQGLLMSQLARDALAIVLAGGRGTRLGPLTEWRTKPAVPFGGKFRIIDFSLSNCVNSGVRRIGICTQYKAQSLIRHIQRGWSFLDGRFREFVELLPAQQRVTVEWYKGTADAVYQNLDILRRHAPEYVLILAGDHVYKMDYARLLAEHVARGADVSVGCVEVPIGIAREYGVMALDDQFHIVDFEEKPLRPKPAPGRQDIALASMGIYVFNASFLYEQLIRDADDSGSSRDFGRDLIPYLIKHGHRVFAHRFADSCVNMVEGRPYWRDVGTIDAYWEANLDLTHVTPDLNLAIRSSCRRPSLCSRLRIAPAQRSTRSYPAAASSAAPRYDVRCCSPMFTCTAIATSRTRWSCPMSRCIARSCSGSASSTGTACFRQGSKPVSTRQRTASVFSSPTAA